MLVNLILWIAFGALAGWLASMIAGNNERQGALGNIVVGILGAILGGFIVSLLGGGVNDTFSWYGLLVAIGGAVLIIYMKRKLVH